MGDIQPNEEISLDYDIKFGANALSGLYNLSSEVDFANGKKALFEKNGFINYIKNEAPKAISTKPQFNSDVIPSDGSDYESIDNSLNDLLNQLDANVAHADSGQLSTSSNLFDPPNVYYSLMSFVLMLLSSAYPFLPKPH